MIDSQPNNPLHGVTLEMILTHLVDRYGWEELEPTINIKCFTHEPSIKSSLKFLHSRIPTGFIQHFRTCTHRFVSSKTPWARDKVEALYLRSLDLNGSTD